MVNGGGSNTTQPDYDEEPSNKVENLQFYYHPDHLGSSSYISDVSGEVYQHMEYFPFGETFIEERTDAEYTSYLYNGKELDVETGLYYYGARYYDPRISMFYGVDPLSEKYPSISPFAYTANNPLNLIDPDGREFEKPEDKKIAQQSQSDSWVQAALHRGAAHVLQSKSNLSEADKASLKEYNDMAGIMDDHANHLGQMIKTKDVKYSYTEVGGDQNTTETSLNKDGIVTIQYQKGNLHNQVHEENHGYQYLTGELTSKRKSEDLYDEASSYQVDYSMTSNKGREAFKNWIKNPDIKSVRDITANNLAKSENANFQDIYKKLIRKFNRNKQ